MKKFVEFCHATDAARDNLLVCDVTLYKESHAIDFIIAVALWINPNLEGKFEELFRIAAAKYFIEMPSAINFILPIMRLLSWHDGIFKGVLEAHRKGIDETDPEIGILIGDLNYMGVSTTFNGTILPPVSHMIGQIYLIMSDLAKEEVSGQKEISTIKNPPDPEVPGISSPPPTWKESDHGFS